MLRELAYDGTTHPGGTAGDYDNATLVHVAGIPSEPMRMRWATTPDPLLLLAAATLVAFGDFYAYGAYTPRSLRLVAYGCLALGAALLLPRVRASYDVLLPQLSIVTLVVWQGLTLVRATMTPRSSCPMALSSPRSSPSTRWATSSTRRRATWSPACGPPTAAASPTSER